MSYDDARAQAAEPFPIPVILAVDDSPEVLGLLRHTLARTFTVLVATNGKEAIERLEQAHVDLLLTDITMPVMGGLELADFVHRHYPHIRVGFVSSCVDDDTMRAAVTRLSGASLAKPFTLKALRGVVDRLMAA